MPATVLRTVNENLTFVCASHGRRWQDVTLWESVEPNGMMDTLQDEIGQWGDATFGKDHKGKACLAHFFREVVELAQAAGMFDELLAACIDRKRSHDSPCPEEAPEEAADCVLLLLQFAYREGFSLQAEIVKKHAVNRQRKWGQPDEDGVVEHVRPENQRGGA